MLHAIVLRVILSEFCIPFRVSVCSASRAGAGARPSDLSSVQTQICPEGRGGKISPFPLFALLLISLLQNVIRQVAVADPYALSHILLAMLF
jgi:hypothetical protein